jgi:hypothetical protein
VKVPGKAILIAALLAVVVAGALFFVWTNIDRIVKAAIERYGSEAVKTAVRVSSVTIRLTKGEGAVSGLTVANPPGFSEPSAFRLGRISARINSRSLTSPVVVIDEVRIAAPEVVYELDSTGSSNIDRIRKNLTGPQPEARRKEEKGSRGTEKRIIINRLVIERGRINVHAAGLDERHRTVALPRIEMNGIGKPRGALPATVAREVLREIAEAAGRQVLQAGAERYIQKSLDRYLRR